MRIKSSSESACDKKQSCERLFFFVPFLNNNGVSDSGVFG